MKDYLIKDAKSYQFVFANLLPKCFVRVNDNGIQSKLKFNVHYKTYLGQKSIFDWCQKNSFLPSNDSINENNENIDANSTPLNMTHLNEEEKDIKKEDDVTATTSTTVVVVDDKNEKKKKTAKTKIMNEEKKQMKLKMSSEKKRQKRNEKKRKLEEQLVENTQKLKKTKKVNKNKNIVI